MLGLLKELTAEERNNECVKFGLNVRKALATGNYGRFFKLYKMAPKMCGYLMEVFID